MCEVTPLFPSRDRSALAVALKPSVVRGTSISFPPLPKPSSHSGRISISTTKTARIYNP
jgi:hypothetical protein